MSEISVVVERMRELREQLASLADVRLLGASDEELCALTVATEEAGRLLDSLRVAEAGELGERSAPGLGHDSLAVRLGQGRAVMLIAHLTKASNAEAARRMKLGAATRVRATIDGTLLPAAHPAVATALASGEVGVESATRIVKAMDEASRTATDEEIACAESELVGAARTDTADEVGVQAIVWREFLDADGAEPREERAHRRRAFRFGAERDGLVPFSGEMEPIPAALLKASFEEAFKATKPRFLPDADTSDPSAPADPLLAQLAKDPRTLVQRQHDVLVGLLTAGTRSTGHEPGGMRSTAQVTAVISLDDLKQGKGVGWVEGIREPLSATALQRLVEGSGYATMVVGDNGEILWLTRHNRLFTTAQIKALIARDGGCVWPGCGARAGQCDAHHVTPWSQGGPTDIDNGVLLCPFHHGMLHDSAFTLAMIRGRPHLLAPPWIDPDQRWVPLGKSRIDKLNTLRTHG